MENIILMRLFQLLLLHGKFLLLISATSINEDIKQDTLNNNRSYDTNECTFYVAESSIPGAGMGLYSTIDIPKGHLIPQSDMTIAVTDLDIHNIQRFNGEYPQWIHFDYFWAAEYPHEFFLAKSVEINSFPLGALTNFHTSLYNVIPSTSVYKDTYLNRTKDSGAGAFSYHVERKFQASRNIRAGEEMFSNYGEGWLDDHSLEDVPRQRHFTRVEKIVQEIKSLSENIKKKKNEDDELDDDVLQSIQKIVGWYDRRTASLLPTTTEKLDTLMNNENTGDRNSIGWNTVTKRTPEWIRENGQCLDNIIPRVSTIKQAGQGAFASRALKAGQVISPQPLLQLYDRDTMDMYELNLGARGKVTPNFDKPKITKQLMLNYCFGHEESSMLLCPSTNAALINHKSSRINSETCHITKEVEEECNNNTTANGPNAYFRWSEWDPKTNEWLKMSIDDMKNSNNGRGLSFEIIALRDIQQGEEIFIDYGNDWENAWNKHVKEWTPIKDGWASNSISAQYMNEVQYEIRTIEKLEVDPYPEHLMLGCLYWEFDDDDEDEEDEDYETVYQDSEEDNEYLEDMDDDDDDKNSNTNKNNTKQQKGEWQNLSLDRLLDRYSSSAKILDFSQSEGTEYWPCRVYLSHDNNTKFTVRIYQSPYSEEPTKWTIRGEPHFVTDLPREAIKFFDRPRKSDQFLPNAFRHYIGIPDDMFPEQWKNIKKEN